MRKGFLIYEEMRKYFPIYEEAVSHIWLCNCSTLSFPIYDENFIFFFSSAAINSLCLILSFFSYILSFLCKFSHSTLQRQMPKIWNKYSQKGNIRASVPVSTFMCLWANYIFSRWVCLFCWRKYVDRSWEYINRSQTHECRNWGCGRAIPRKGIFKRNCRCSARKSFLQIQKCKWRI